MIVETYELTADNTDVLAAPSRLASIPYDGQLIIELQSSASDASNNFTVTVQLPDGSTPLENVRVPAGATAGAINADDKYLVAFPAVSGGHVLVSADETGTAVLSARFTLMP